MGFLDRFLRGKTGADSAPTLPRSAAAAAAPLPLDRPRFAVLDVETTGLSPASHRIVEIAVVTTDPHGQVIEEWTTRLNPQGPVGATHIHGITDADVAHAPTFPEVIPELNRRLAGAAIAAHHAKFDLAFLRAEYARLNWHLPRLPSLCTLEASKHHLPRLDRRRLADCCWAVGSPLTAAHTALGDARATAGLLAAFMHPQVRPLPEHLELPARALSIAWPSGPSRSNAASERLARGAAPTLPARVQRAIAAQAHVAPPMALVELVERFSLIDALDEGAPAGALAYLEKLAEVLEDGEMTTGEAADLAAVAESEQLASRDVAVAHRAFVRALAHAALDDGKVSRAERAELQSVAELLDVDSRMVPTLLEEAEEARNERLSQGLHELPVDWPHGEPLRVGDKVVFTGCDDAQRTRLERRSEKVGVRILGGVSAKTAMLVTDGSMDRTKAAKARELGTRTVSPAVYEVLLDHLQPAEPRPAQLAVAARNAGAQVVPTAGEAGPDARVTSASLGTRVGPSPADVRAWARANGFEVGTRGRLHKDILDAYAAAHG